MKREECLKKAKEIINGERAEQYGKAADNFTTIAKLWTDCIGYHFTLLDVANMMILLKIARCYNGRKNKIDNYIDICGYASIASEFIEEE